MNLCLSLMWRRTARGKPASRPAAPDWVNATLDTVPQDEPDRARCCGWFDSSHDLHAGMQMTEHLTPEPVANEVPLGWWLDWQSHDAGLAAVATVGAGLRQAQAVRRDGLRPASAARGLGLR